MSDPDQGDIFLRHRDAILDALLSDPYFGGSEAGEFDEGVEVPAVSPPAPSGASAPVADEASSVTSSPDPGLFDRSEDLGTESAQPPPRRSSAGPSASERINALLSGQSTAPGTERGPDFAQAAADRINRDVRDQQETSAQPAAESARPATEERTSPQQLVQEVSVQLRKPKVALAVAAAVALLIVLLLVFTSGGDDRETKPLAVAPPTSASPPPAGVPEQGGTIVPEKAEASCPPGGTDGMDAFSGEPDKAWSCVRAYKVDGQILRIDLGKEYKVDSIGIVPGWDYVGSDGADQWSEFRTVSIVSYELDDGDEATDKTVFTQKTLDQRSLVVTKIEPPIAASEIVVTVLKSGGDSSANTVAISSIVITGQE